ncbi:MAG: biotin transporter BioY [Acidobacteriota bacterium]
MQTISTSSAPAASLQGFSRSIPGRLTLGLAATAVVAASAHVVFPLPFTPVPFILTPLAVLGVGLAFGPIDGFFILLAYLAEGLCGLPVFSHTGPGGIAQLLGPTGGYLMAYPFVAAIAGGLTRMLVRRTSSFPAALAGCSAAVAFLFLCGAAWFSHYTHTLLQAASLHTIWLGSVAPFLPGEAIKVLAAAGIYSTLTRGRHNQASGRA